MVSSPSAVEECFTKNDVVLADRPRFASGKYVGYNYTTISAASYGEHWRNLRRLGTLEIFSSNRLNMFLGIRRDEVKRLLLRLARDSREGFAKVEMRPMLTELTFNIVTRMVAGKRYYGEDVEYTEAKRFREIISQLLELGGATSNPADFLPILRWIGLGYHEKKIKKIMRETKAMLQGLIDEHRSGNDKGSVDNNSMIDHLLSLQKTEPEYYTDDIIKGLVQNLILAGTDTAASTMEWAMTLLLNHPDVLEKAKAELDMHVGKDCLIEESDLPKLRYLQSIISETLRVFPVAPLLLPHMSSDDCQIGGFDIPRGTLLLVNAWALHRDPQVWEDPTSFKPERFENGERENYKLLPFGIGRRSCPGAGLAQRVVGLALGSLIQCYDWKKISNTAIDTIEGKGLTMPKLQPLEAMCKAREIINQNLSKKYGPIFSLRFGSSPVVIISSPSTVEECFTKNDIIFANRPRLLIGKYIGYNYTTIASASYGEHWRNLRRLSALEIFSSNRLNMFLGIRRNEINILLHRLSPNSRDNFARVELRPMFTELTCNIIMRMVAGKRYYGEDVDSEEAKHFQKIMRGIFELAGASNPGDFLPLLRWVDFGGYEKKLVKLNREKDVIFQGLINEHRSPDEGLVNKDSMIIKGLALVSELLRFVFEKIGCQKE
ncbi:hypothetical protein PVL29_026857 [Vitis rotundifolia]|uniref:Cytochrome P450 n=1 Tax=Vitis rotundifolia TaxID=103349 RepID=A0AA38YHJ3_VITRO|nr:hypothetical protein PVL29_026857 [Vitis rotundifolia]